MTRYLGSVPAQRWTPLDLGSSLVAWYDADVASSVTSDANGVSQWSDRSGNGYHATQTTNANKPSYASSRVSFDGGDYLNASVSMSTLSRCVALVVDTDNANNKGTFVGPQSSSGAWAMGRRPPDQGSDARKIYIAKSGVAYIAQGSTSITLADDTDSVVLANTTATTWRISRNGTAETGTHSQTLDANRTLQIGAEATALPLQGSMRELVIASSLATADQERLEGYLAWKWGLVSSLAAGHAYKTQAP